MVPVNKTEALRQSEGSLCLKSGVAAGAEMVV